MVRVPSDTRSAPPTVPSPHSEANSVVNIGWYISWKTKLVQPLSVSVSVAVSVPLPLALLPVSEPPSRTRCARTIGACRASALSIMRRSDTVRASSQ